jgi:pheromone shutdown protein TraB
MIGLQKGATGLQENILFWIMINGIPSAICTALAMGNPITILAAFVFAPFTSLTPVIGVGYVTALVQAYVSPPRVDEIESSINDATKIKGWFKNKLLRILLVFIFSTFGSIFGTWTGGAKLLGSIY